MPNKNGQQGTQWETTLTSFVSPADRISKRSVKGEPDVWWFTHPSTADILVPAVAWKRLVNTGKQRRQPDGVRDVIVLHANDFANICEAAVEQDYKLSVLLQAKATERLNVTRTLDSLTRAVDHIYYGAPEKP